MDKQYKQYTIWIDDIQIATTNNLIDALRITDTMETAVIECKAWDSFVDFFQGKQAITKYIVDKNLYSQYKVVK